VTLHAVTVHWQEPRWIEPQHRFLVRNLPEDHRLYASLNGIDPRHGDRFWFAEDLEGTHSEKLNRLAEIASEGAAPDDLLLFVDGDAFPIAPVTTELLGGTPLAAVRRDENAGDRQPHPSFCLTTVGFWKEIGGDWRRGYEWTASTGDRVTDVGGNLLGILESNGIAWRPLLRSNRWNLDPFWFGIYADVAYHHGAGFRPPVARHAELETLRELRRSTASTVAPRWLPGLDRVERSLRYRFGRRRQLRELERRSAEAQRLSDEVFGWIEEDDEFFRRFLEPPRGRA
jgi:hypothetical protein